MVVTQVAFHSKLVNRSGIIHANLSLFCIVSDSHSYVVLTAITPDVVGHLKADDQNPQMEFPSSFSQGMSTEELVEPTDFRVVVGRVVMVLTLALTHLDRSEK